MRPLRFLLSLATCVAAFLILVYVGPWRSTKDYAEQDFDQNTGIRAYFSWRAPSSLFPPSAIISLTDDNSTFFLARPAAFGPLLPAKSLDGQLWIGSGFGDDRLGRGWIAESQGELGCSDIPDWIDGTHWTNLAAGRKLVGDATRGGMVDAQGTGMRKRSMPAETDDEKAEHEEHHANGEDGTDDHLHHPLSPSDGLKTKGGSAGKTRKPAHADIQSIQEGAEIAGKIVLLSRGGCGFLEKAKWVQRRGGVALIVGDNIRGGPLVTMYARGDTSNVTIPALFTSYTTAHLLTTLIPSGGAPDELSQEDFTNLDEAIRHQMQDVGSASPEGADIDRVMYATTSASSKSKLDAETKLLRKELEVVTSIKHSAIDEATTRSNNGWLRKIFRSQAAEQRKHSSRPPTSGSLDWGHLDDFEGINLSTEKKIVATKTNADRKKIAPDGVWDDGFVIGVQDWRDPDLLVKPSTESISSSAVARQTNAIKKTGLKGGSITPGSGEYAKAAHNAADLASPSRSYNDIDGGKNDGESDGSADAWYSHIWSAEEEAKYAGVKTSPHAARPSISQAHHEASEDSPAHEGLWVTLSPTSMSSSPFFDTLLVLVVSPLVTLTVVYALLLLRSRIRRRRWRAPKSVVERLPVRTYQTISSASSTTSTVAVSPIPSATTPLLPSAARAINSTSRPRSRTASEVPALSRSSVPSMASPSLRQIEETRAAGLAEWRRRYGGKQRECVVCLEEYVDGVSRVMSLPCGHEFHAECITPWLTTRRRTCPICKGDVVRSLASNAHASSASLGQSQYQDYSDAEDEEEEAEPIDNPQQAQEVEDQIQQRAVHSRNDDPASAQPISREDEAFEDLERGVDRIH